MFRDCTRLSNARAGRATVLCMCGVFLRQSTRSPETDRTGKRGPPFVCVPKRKQRVRLPHLLSKNGKRGLMWPALGMLLPDRLLIGRRYARRAIHRVSLNQQHPLLRLQANIRLLRYERVWSRVDTGIGDSMAVRQTYFGLKSTYFGKC